MRRNSEVRQNEALMSLKASGKNTVDQLYSLLQCKHRTSPSVRPRLIPSKAEGRPPNSLNQMHSDGTKKAGTLLVSSVNLFSRSALPGVL
jgi:hypothetical protein